MTVSVEYRRAWAKAHPEQVKAASKRYRAKPEGRAKALLSSIRRNAKRRRLSCSITYLDLLPALIRGVCEMTGLPFDMGAARCSPRSPSVDRIDNALGYEPGNVQMVVFAYNAAKGRGTHEDVLELAAALNGARMFEKRVGKA